MLCALKLFSRSDSFDWIFPDDHNVGVLASLMQCLGPALLGRMVVCCAMRFVIFARRVLLHIENINVPHTVSVVIGNGIGPKQLCFLSDGDLLHLILDLPQFRSAQNSQFIAVEGHATGAVVRDVSVTLMGKTCDDSGCKAADLATISSPIVAGGVSTLLRFCQSFLPIMRAVAFEDGRVGWGSDPWCGVMEASTCNIFYVSAGRRGPADKWEWG